MRLETLGDSAFIVYDLGYPAHLVAKAVEKSLSMVREAVPSYETVGLYFDPGAIRAENLLSQLEQLQIPAASSSKTHQIPVCYEMGEDLDAVAFQLQVQPERVVEQHSSTAYECFAIGFCPGFPYLGYLPESISGVPRKSQPRVRVEKGSVAITGRQTGVYPSLMPGGWSLIGRTPLEIANLRDGYFPIAAGDSVVFVPIDREEFERLEGERL